MRSTRVITACPVRTLVESEGVGAFGGFHDDRVVGALRGIVLGQLRAQAAGLDANHGVHMWVEVLLASEDFCRNLVLLRGGTGMVQGMIRQVTEQFAKGFRAMESVAAE